MYALAYLHSFEENAKVYYVLQFRGQGDALSLYKYKAFYNLKILRMTLFHEPDYRHRL